MNANVLLWVLFLSTIFTLLRFYHILSYISVWGKVGHCHPPHLVMPLTVEPSKPRLCNDNRFLNLWIQDRPFSLDSIQHLPKYFQTGFYQTVCDDKSGYDHIQLSSNSRTFFGFEWGVLCVHLSYDRLTTCAFWASLRRYTLATAIHVSFPSLGIPGQLLMRIFRQKTPSTWTWPMRLSS